MQGIRLSQFIPSKRILLPLVFFAACSSLPDGQEGEGAERRLDEMLLAHNSQAWKDTAAVSFTFRGRDNLFWDKKRKLVELTWGEGDLARFIQFKEDFSRVLVRAAGKDVASGPAFDETVKKGNALFVNDTYWLNPLLHARSPGAKRYLLADGSLRVTFTSGGVTPGDSFIFEARPDNTLSMMRMWTSSFKWNPGMKATFEEAITTDTGVKVSVDHKLFGGLVHVRLENMKMSAEYPVKGDTDRFQALLSVEEKR